MGEPKEIYERINTLCKKKHITIAELERQINFSSGSIGKMKYGASPSSARLVKIADFFGVTTDYLQTGDAGDGYYLNPETARAAQEIFENEELSLLFDAARDASPEDLRTVHAMLLALKRKEEPHE